MRTILVAHGKNLVKGNLFAIQWAFFSLLTPFVVRALLKNISTGAETYNFLGVTNPWALATIIFVSQLLQSIGYNQACSFVGYAGVTMRGSMVSAVYRKSLRLTSKARQISTSGEMVNLMSNDAMRIWKACQIGHFAWCGFVMTVAVCFILVLEVGWIGGLAGSTLIGLITPTVLLLSRYQGLLRRRMLKFTDKRVEIMGEVLSGIRVVKQYNWQIPVSKKVQQIRKDEIYVALLSHLYNGLSKMIMYLSPSLLMLVVFGVFSLNNGTMDVSLVLTILAFLNSVRFPMMVMPFAAQAIAEAMVSAERLGKYMALEELPHVARYGYGSKPSHSGGIVADVAGVTLEKTAHYDNNNGREDAVRITDGSFTWDADDGAPILKNINITIKKGELLGVVGLVGSGKSSLILSMLRETNALRGSVEINGAVAYCSQQPWIQNATVRDNILFGQPYKDELYKKITDSAMLLPDFKSLAAGDMTEIGERGVNLSGGQKARVSLSRALYIADERDIFLLDDPLSAVDEETATVIFRKAIKNFQESSEQALLENKTRVVVMNSHLHLLRHMDKIVVLENGAVVSHGTLQEVVQDVLWIKSLVNEVKSSDNDLALNGSERVVTSHSQDAQSSDSEKVTPEAQKECTKTEADDGALVKSEDRAKGRVDLDVYLFYFANAWPGHGKLLTILIIVIFLFSESGRIASDYALSLFANDSTPPNHWIGWYCGIVAALATVTFARTLIFVTATVYAGKHLHDNLFTSILGAHVTHFFDVTPTGRILNRFAGDMDQIDGLLPRFFLMLLEKIWEMFGVMVLCCLSTPYFVLLFIPLGFVFVRWMNYFRATNRVLKRLESVSRSPVISLFEETLRGLDSIRGYGMSQTFVKELENRMDINNSAYWFYYISGRWLSVRLDGLSCIVVYAAAAAIVAFSDSISLIAAGLALVYAMMMTAKLQGLVRNAVDVEGYMVAVERLKYYSNVEMEGVNQVVEEPSVGWPLYGAIEFIDVSMRYRPGLPLVLKHMSMTIKAGEKVGICGRTGAGKSSIMASLLRLVDVEGGKILIDGIDTGGMSLGQLRTAVAIIPQDPVLFSGTVRFNLDPFDQFSDDDVWRVLKDIQMFDRVKEDGSGHKCGLQTVVAENGGNFSVGESQLLCIGRALLRKTKIVLLDEATASCDGKTDAVIQDVMKTKFKQATVLTIAHRLETIIFYDKIAVISEGKIVELASPRVLLHNPNSSFSKLVDEMGKDSKQRMMAMVGLDRKSGSSWS